LNKEEGKVPVLFVFDLAFGGGDDRAYMSNKSTSAFPEE